MERITKTLRETGSVEFEGATLRFDPSPLAVGDTYLAQRNGPPRLLTVRKLSRYMGEGQSVEVQDIAEASWVVPVEPAYCFDVGECVKVTLSD